MAGKPICRLASLFVVGFVAGVEHLALDPFGKTGFVEAGDRLKGTPDEDAGVASELHVPPLADQLEVCVGLGGADDADRFAGALDAVASPSPRVGEAIRIDEGLSGQLNPSRCAAVDQGVCGDGGRLVVCGGGAGGCCNCGNGDSAGEAAAGNTSGVVVHGSHATYNYSFHAICKGGEFELPRAEGAKKARQRRRSISLSE